MGRCGLAPALLTAAVLLAPPFPASRGEEWFGLPTDAQTGASRVARWERANLRRPDGGVAGPGMSRLRSDIGFAPLAPKGESFWLVKQRDIKQVWKSAMERLTHDWEPSPGADSRDLRERHRQGGTRGQGQHGQEEEGQVRGSFHPGEPQAAGYVPTERKARKFVILANPRTGSTLLQKLLSQHPHIAMYGEVMNLNQTFRSYLPLDKAVPEGYMGLSEWKEMEQARTKEPDRMINWVWDHPAGRSAVGVKMIADHMPWQIVDTLLLDDPSVLKIVLVRRNFMASLVSLLKGWQFMNGLDWHSGDTSQLKVTVRLKDLQRRRNLNEGWYLHIWSRLGWRDQSWVDVTYRELTDPEKVVGALDRIVGFLGLPPHDFKPIISKKQNTSPPWKSIENWEQVRGWVRQAAGQRNLLQNMYGFP